MKKKVLLVGGCVYTFHQLEPVIEPIRAAMAAIGVEVDATGIFHPGGGEEYTGDYSAISSENLSGYDGVVLYTTGMEPRGADIDALLAAVRGGKALIGIHCAADSFGSSAEFVTAIGGYFRTHPAPLEISVEYVDRLHAITEGLEPFTVRDELYLFKDYDPSRVRLLAQTNTYDDDGPVPIAWTREEGRGRIFYLSLGHFPETMADPSWRMLFERGAQWSLGE